MSTGNKARCPICTLWHGGARCHPVPADTRWPWAPVAALTRGATTGELADRFGATDRTIQRWVHDGIPDARSDAVAVALGRHPVELWGLAWADAALRPIDAAMAATGWRPAWLAREQAA